MRVKVAVATRGSRGLSDEVADTFGRAKTFTIIKMVGKRAQVKIVANPAASYEHGRGPAVVQMLLNEGVNVVVASKFGPGATAFLQQDKIKKIVAKTGSMVIDVLRSKILKYDS